MYSGCVLVEEGRPAEGIRLVTEGLAAYRATGNRLYVPVSEAMLSDASLLGGDAGAALAHVEEAFRISARTGEAWFDAELHRRLGCVLLRVRPGEPDRAEGEFRRGLAIARSQSALLFELRAARDLAFLLRDRGRVAEARGLLAPVYASFTEGFAFPDLVGARALLEELGAAPEDYARGSSGAARAPAVPGAAAGPAPDR
jgi:predicted ATPase